MDSLDDSENNAKISDSAYSTSCSNSQSRRSHSSKSTHSGSHSSGSSGYGGKPSTSGSSNQLEQPSDKRIKDKDAKKKKSTLAETIKVQPPAETEIRPSALEVIEDASVMHQDATKDDVELLPPPALPDSNNLVENMDLSTSVNSVGAEDGVVNKITSNASVTLNTQLVQFPGLPVFPNDTDGFSCVISMHDGVVMYTTTSITNIVGFPKDMWIGRSFIDFIHPLDRDTFASQIMIGVAVPKNASGIPAQPLTNTTLTMCCRIRKYRGLKSGFEVKKTDVDYLPFVLSLSFKEIAHDDKREFYLVIQANSLSSAYKVPNEAIHKPTPFVTRHEATGKIEYVDPESVQYLGYLPQELMDKDALLLYHPDDMADLMQVYDAVVRKRNITRSNVYRMLAQNGDYVKLETEFSCFVNPWSRKLEFVSGKHFVVEGPNNPDVFFTQTGKQKVSKITDAQKHKAQIFRHSIIHIMSEEMTTKTAEAAKQQMTKRCMELASYMETLVEEQPKPIEELRVDIQEQDNSYYERDSVMLGGISPHHENESKSSSDTHLSYDQLNYNETLQRYFDSYQPCSFEEYTTVDGENILEDRNSKRNILPVKEHQSKVGPPELKPELETFDQCSQRLSEILIIKHNSEMEKELVKKHHEQRTYHNGYRGKISKEERRQKKKNHLARCNAPYQPTSVEEQPPHGVKRTSWQSDHANSKSHKHHCSWAHKAKYNQVHCEVGQAPVVPVETPITSHTTVANQHWTAPSTSGIDTLPEMPAMNPVAIPGIIPMYYVPTPTSIGAYNGTYPSTCVPNTQLQSAVPYVMYPQAVFGTPFMYSSFGSTPAYHWVNSNVQTTRPNQQPLGLTSSNYEEACKPSIALKLQKNSTMRWNGRRAAESQGETSSSRAERGSGVSISLCSSTLPSNRESGEQSSDSGDLNPMMNSSLACPRPKFVNARVKGDHRKGHAPSFKNKSQVAWSGSAERTDGESISSSSFCSSFFRTESGSGGENDFKNKNQTVENKIKNIKVTKRSEPPWMEQVSVTSDLVYKYQMTTKEVDQVLEQDKKKMVNFEQPHLVNEQLSQLYIDLQLEGVPAKLMLEEGITSSGSSSEDTHLQPDVRRTATKCIRKRREYSRLVMIYEEDAPIPSPVDNTPLSPLPSTSNQ